MSSSKQRKSVDTAASLLDDELQAIFITYCKLFRFDFARIAVQFQKYYRVMINNRPNRVDSAHFSVKFCRQLWIKMYNEVCVLSAVC
jgi:hypothetical protein